MATVNVPTRTSPLEYREQVTLDGIVFTLLFTYNLREDFWYLDLLDSSDVPVKQGIKLVTGFSLLRLVADTTIRPPGGLVAVDPTGQDREPGRETLGTDSILIYIEEADLPAGTR